MNDHFLYRVVIWLWAERKLERGLKNSAKKCATKECAGKIHLVQKPERNRTSKLVLERNRVVRQSSSAEQKDVFFD